jgi:hypothetical protein
MTFNSNSNTFKSRHGYNWADLTDNEDNDTPEYNPNINNDKTNQELNLNNLVVDKNQELNLNNLVVDKNQELNLNNLVVDKNQELNLNNLVVDTKTTEEKKTQIYFYGIILYKEKLTSTFYLQSLTHPEYTGIYIRYGELLHLIDVRLTKQVEMMKNIMIKYNIIYTV